MPEARHELGRAIKLNADAIGEPGQRHFRLLIEAESGSACLWLEKEQLFQLALVAQRLLASASQETSSREAEEPPSFAQQGLALDFKIDRIVLGQDTQRALFLLAAHNVEEVDDEIPAVQLLATRDQLQALAEEALEVCAAGRPRCHLCGQPDPHVCIRSNGHITSQETLR